MFNLSYLVKTYNLTDLEKQVIQDEGFKTIPYQDTKGYWTCGVGWNMDANPMRESEVIFRLRNDLLEAKGYAEKFDWFKNLNEVRQNVIIEMIFNLGLNKFNQFQKMIIAIKNNHFSEAAHEMLNSKWATQVKGRAERLAAQMESGKL